MSAALARLSVLVAMAWRNLFSARGRNALVGLIMVLGTFLVVLGTSLLDSIEQSMTRSITSSIAGHLQVHSDAARDELALFGGGMMGRPDLGVIADFDVVKRALSEVDNVRAVVPMGTDTAEFQTATELDYAIERVRKARQAGDERRLGDAVARLRSMLALMQEEFEARRTAQHALTHDEKEYDRTELLAVLEKEMLDAAEALEFEKAAQLRDQIAELKDAPEVAAGKKVRKKGV